MKETGSNFDFGENAPAEELYKYISTSFPNEPPTMQSYFEDYPKITKLVELIISSLSQGVIITPDAFKQIGLGIRHVISEIVQINTSKTIDSEILKNVREASGDTDAMNKLKIELYKAKQQKEGNESLIKDLEEEIRNMQQSNDAAYQEREKMANATIALKNQFSEKISKMELDYRLLEIKNQELEQKLQGSITEEEKLKNQITMMMGEDEENKERMKQLNEKLNQKKEKINAMNIKIRQLVKDNEEKDITIQKQSIDISILKNQSVNKKLEKQIVDQQAKYKNEIEKLNKKIDSRDMEIERLKAKSKENEEKYKEASFMNEDSTLRLEEVQKDADNANDKIESLQRRLNNALEEKKEALKREETTQAKFNELEKSMSKITKILNCETSECSQQVEKMSNEMNETNKLAARLRTVADSCATFIQRIATGNAPQELLHEASFITNNEEVRREILKQLTRLRSIIRENPSMKATIDNIHIFDSFFPSEVKTEKLLDSLIRAGFPDEYCAIAGLAAAAECQRKIIEKIVTDLAPLRRYIPSRTQDCDIGKEITQYFKPLAELTAKAAITAQTKGGMKQKGLSDGELVLNFVKFSSAIIHDLDHNVRATLKTKVPLEQLPNEIIAVIVNMKKETHNQSSILLKQSESISRVSFNSSVEFERKSIILDGKIQDLTRENNLLKQRIEQKDTEIGKLRESFNETRAEKDEMEESFMHFNQSKTDLEQALKTVNFERNRLELLLNERNAATERRIKEAINTERKHSATEMKMIEKRFKDEKANLEAQLKEKTEKVASMKKQYREFAKLADDAIKKQKQTINKLMKQNKEFSESTELSIISSNEVQELKEKLANESAEKSRIEAQLALSSISQNDYESIGSAFEEIGISMKPWNTDSIIAAIKELNNTKGSEESDESWKKWCQSLIRKHGISLSTDSDEAIKSTISDLSTAGADKFKLIGTLQSLRIQKKLLQNKSVSLTKSLTQKKGEISFRGVALSMFFIRAIKAKAAKTKQKELQNRRKK